MTATAEDVAASAPRRDGARRWWAWLAGALVLTVVAQWPALGGTLFDDDYQQLGFLSGRPTLPARSWLDLYRLDPDVAFFRPLSSALMAADWHLFHTALVGFHLHSLVWLLVFVALAGLLLRRALPTAAGPAVLFLAASRCAGNSVVWWCNRHLLVAAACGCGAMIAHLAGRQRGWAPGRALALVLLGVALLGGESAIQAALYLIAFELCAAPGSRGERARAIAAIASVTGAYLCIRFWLGYGVHHGKWGYFDPFAEPGRFCVEALHRLPELLMALFGAGLDTFAFLPAGPRLAHALMWLLGAAALVALVRPRLLGLEHDEARTLRWLLVGDLLGLPVALASPRPLVRALPSLALAALVALLCCRLLAAWQRRAAAPAPLKLLAATVAALLIVCYGVAAPLATHNEVREDSQIQQTSHAAMVDHHFASGQRTAVVLAGPWYLYPGKIALDLFRPRVRLESWSLLYEGEEPLVIVRVSANALVLTLSDGAPLESGPWSDWSPGETNEIDPGVQGTVIQATPQGPTSVMLSFAVPLESPALCLLAWNGHELVDVRPPARDEALLLDAKTLTAR
jgi:hypothetical protein